jgi:transposase-like protein
VVKRVGLEKDRCYYALDVCHAVNHIALALEACTEKTPEDRKAQLSRLRRMLKDGRLDEVIAYLEKLKLGRRSAAIKAIEAEIAYLEKRRSLMRYDELVRKKLPIGSGAVESAIRRIINLRVKGAGMFWTPENAEAVIYLRAQALTDRWEEMLERVRKHAMRTRDLEWKWQATPMSFATHETSQLQKQKHVKRCA